MENRSANGIFEQRGHQLTGRCPGLGSRHRRPRCGSRTRRAAFAQAARCRRSPLVCRLRAPPRSDCAWLRARPRIRGRAMGRRRRTAAFSSSAHRAASVRSSGPSTTVIGSPPAVRSSAWRQGGADTAEPTVPAWPSSRPRNARGPPPSGRRPRGAEGRTARRALVSLRDGVGVGGYVGRARRNRRPVDTHAVAIPRPVHSARRASVTTRTSAAVAALSMPIASRLQTPCTGMPRRVTVCRRSGNADRRHT